MQIFQPIGGGSSGGGGGSKNYLGFANAANNNGDFELGTTASATTDVWGNGSATFTSGVPSSGPGTNGTSGISIITSGKLAGTYSFQTISQATTVGTAVLASPKFTIDLEDQAKVLNFNFYYKVTSGATNAVWSGVAASQSFSIWIYDYTNSVWIQPAGYLSMVQSSGVGFANGSFQTASNASQFGLFIFVQNAIAGAVTMLLDDVFIGPTPLVGGTVVTDWVSYTPTFAGLGTVTVTDAQWRRVGANIQVKGRVTAGTITAVTAVWGLPAGLTTSSSIVSVSQAGPPIANNFGSASQVIPLVQASQTGFNFGVQNAASPGYTVQTGSGFATSSQPFTFLAEAPISGWGGTATVSSDSASQVVAATVAFTTTTAISAGAVISFDTVIANANGMWNTTSKAMVAPVAGSYRLSAVLLSTVTGNNVTVAINGTPKYYFITTNNAAFSAGALTIPLNASDSVTLVCQGTGQTFSGISGSIFQNYFSMERLSGPAVVTATESINMAYFNTAGTSVPNTGDNNIPFATKSYDTHNAYNPSTGIFTCPGAGKYSVSSVINYASATYGVNNQLIVSVYKNGVAYAYGSITPIMAIVTLAFGSEVRANVQCVAGDTLEVRAMNTRSAGATSLSTTAGHNHIEINRIGN